jgi:hypothetical protein
VVALFITIIAVKSGTPGKASISPTQKNKEHIKLITVSLEENYIN